MAFPNVHVVEFHSSWLVAHFAVLFHSTVVREIQTMSRVVLAVNLVSAFELQLLEDFEEDPPVVDYAVKLMFPSIMN